jgi:DNA topoisomerase-3
MCRNYKGETDPCDFIIARNIGEKDIPETEIKKLLKGESTKVMKFKSKSTGKTFEASLVIDSETKKVTYSFATEKSAGKCPKCGGNMIDKGKYCKCDNEKCTMSLSKVICGSSLTDKDVKDLLSKKPTATKKFYTNGKVWYAKLKYADDFSKIEFIFDNKKD